MIAVSRDQTVSRLLQQTVRRPQMVIISVTYTLNLELAFNLTRPINNVILTIMWRIGIFLVVMSFVICCLDNLTLMLGRNNVFLWWTKIYLFTTILNISCLSKLTHWHVNRNHIMFSLKVYAWHNVHIICIYNAMVNAIRHQHAWKGKH